VNVDRRSAKDGQGATDKGAPAPAKRRAVAEILSELWHQKPGARAPREETTGSGRTVKQVVDGLDQWELRLSIAAAGLQGVLTPFLYVYWRTHGDAAVRAGAVEFLVTGIISTVLLLLGAVFKRRALVGFAAFMTGFAWFTYGEVLLGALYLFFGGSLILRVMRKQKQDRAAGKPVESLAPRRASDRPAPAPSKRYTPPRNATRSSTARGTTSRKASTTSRKATQGPTR